MTKIFIDLPLKVGDNFKIKGNNYRHLSVLKKNIGEEILVGDNKFDEFKARIIEITKKGYAARITTETQNMNVPIRYVTLYVSLPKKKKFEDIIFKCTQLGISEFIPIISYRTIKKIKNKNSDIEYTRWRKKALQGAELSCRKRIPSIGNVMNFKDALEDYYKKYVDSGVLLWEKSGYKYISKNDFADKMAIFIGPEGGFSETEIKQAVKIGIKIRTLGNLIMDVETASIAGASVILCTGK